MWFLEITLCIIMHFLLRKVFLKKEYDKSIKKKVGEA